MFWQELKSTDSHIFGLKSSLKSLVLVNPGLESRLFDSNVPSKAISSVKCPKSFQTTLAPIVYHHHRAILTYFWGKK